MNEKHFIFAVAVLLSACGRPSKIEQSVESLERSNIALKSQQAENAHKIEELSASVQLLQERLETVRVAAERRPPPPPPPAPVKKQVKAKHKAKSKQARKSKPKRPAPSKPKEETFLGVGETGRDLPAIQLSNKDIEQRETPKPPDDPEAIKAYNEAYKKFEEENFPEAVKMLEAFVAKYPKHEYADNAVYWIGESYFRTRDFVKAGEQFERVAKVFPAGNKVPDALLRAGACYLKLEKPAEAKGAFEKIVQGYPDSVAAQKAKTYLSEIPGGERKGG